MKTAFLRIERSQGASTVDADQPIGFRAAHSGLGQWLYGSIVKQFCKTLANRGGCHRLQPQALDRFFGCNVARNVMENQFPFASRVASINERVHILALDQFGQELQARLGFLDGMEIKVWRNYRQIGKTPFATFDFVLFRHRQFKQVTDGRRQHILIVLEVIGVLGKATQYPRNVCGDRRFLGDD